MEGQFTRAAKTARFNSLMQFKIQILSCVGWSRNQGTLKGKYHCTFDLLFDWFGNSYMTTDNFCFYSKNRLIPTSQTGGQWYSDTSLFSIPCQNSCLNCTGQQNLAVFQTCKLTIVRLKKLVWSRIYTGKDFVWICHRTVLVLSHNHRYLREVDCWRYISLTKNPLQKTRAQTMEVGRQGSRARSITEPTFTANIFAEATTRTNITTRQAVRAINQSI